MKNEDLECSKINAELDQALKAMTSEDLINTAKECTRELIMEEYFLTTQIRIHF